MASGALAGLAQKAGQADGELHGVQAAGPIGLENPVEIWLSHLALFRS